MFSLYGLAIQSAIDLPWAGRSDASVPDVVIRRGTLKGGEVANPEFVQFAVAGLAAYRITGGREIVVDAAPGAADADVRLYLTGSAMGVLLHQRGLLVLHANAIAIDGGAILFAGPSGAGKSSLAAWFAGQGHGVFADDVCPLAVGEGPIMALPGIARIRLDPVAGGHLGAIGADGAPCARSGKYEVAIGARHQPSPLPVRAIYTLAEPESAAPLAISRLDGLGAIDALITNTYRGFALPALGASRRHLAQCLRVTSEVPVFAVAREKDWDRFDAVGETLLDHARHQRGAALVS